MSDSSWVPRKYGSAGTEILGGGVHDLAQVGQHDYNRTDVGDRLYCAPALVVRLNLIGCYELLEQGLLHKTLLS